MFSTVVVVMVSQVRYMSKLIKMYILNLCNFSYISYTSIKLKTIELKLNIWFLFIVYLDLKLQKDSVTLVIFAILYSVYDVCNIVPNKYLLKK